MIFTAWATVDVYKTIVVTSRDELLILALLDNVDVSAVSSRRVNSINKPAELDSMVIPGRRSRSRGTAWHLFFHLWVKEEKFIGATA